jgi:hypothetical protein
MLLCSLLVTTTTQAAHASFSSSSKVFELEFEHCNEYAVEGFRHHTSPALLSKFSEEHRRTILQAAFAIRYNAHGSEVVYAV